MKKKTKKNPQKTNIKLYLCLQNKYYYQKTELYRVKFLWSFYCYKCETTFIKKKTNKQTNKQTKKQKQKQKKKRTNTRTRKDLKSSDIKAWHSI